MIVKRIAPLSAAKIVGMVYAAVALPFVLLVWVVSLVGLSSSGLNGSPFLPFAPGFVTVGGAVAVIMLPIFYGIFGFVMTLITVSLFNYVAKIVGGLSVEIQMDTPPDVTAG